jgi:Bardet-Biedl syndrome 9 protein
MRASAGRYKDRNSAPLDQLDTLLAGTFDKIQAASERVDQCREALAATARALGLIAGLTVLLMRLRYELDDANVATLQSVLSSHIDDSDSGEEGWEERTDAAVMHLLRTTLAKTSSKAGATDSAGVAAAELVMPKSLKKFKKHVTILCDRLAKGALPASPAGGSGGGGGGDGGGGDGDRGK